MDYLPEFGVYFRSTNLEPSPDNFRTALGVRFPLRFSLHNADRFGAVLLPGRQTGFGVRGQ